MDEPPKLLLHHGVLGILNLYACCMTPLSYCDFLVFKVSDGVRWWAKMSYLSQPARPAGS